MEFLKQILGDELYTQFESKIKLREYFEHFIIELQANPEKRKENAKKNLSKPDICF